MAVAPTINELRVVADRPALNLVNTIDPREGGAARVDYLRTYPDLVRWAVRIGIVTREQGARLIRLARRNRPRARQSLHDAKTLREALYHTLSTVAMHRRPERGEIVSIQGAFHEAFGRAELEQHGRSFRWSFREDLDLIRAIVARDAVALLESGMIERVKRCPGSGDCGWLFLDTSKNATRRWCSMAGCGNRAKARRFLRKRRRT